MLQQLTLVITTNLKFYYSDYYLDVNAPDYG